MRTFETVYPYFDKLLRDLLIKIERNIEHPRYANPRTLLNILKNDVQFVREEMDRKPSISNVNLEEMVNNLYKKDKEQEAIILVIQLKKNTNPGRFGTRTLNLSKK